MKTQIDLSDAALNDFVQSSIAAACGWGSSVIPLSTMLDDLRIDSLRMIDIVSRIEQEFGARFTTDHILDFFLARDVAELIQIICKSCLDPDGGQ
jgi:acyl carrier protein